MFRTNAVVRTVWVKELTSEKRQGNNGEYDAKSILFRVASDRNYTRTVMKDGKQVQERPTDFALCRANGALAEVIANHCTAKNGEGKLISRHLYLDGHFEMYQSKRNFKIENSPVNIDGVTYNLNFDTKQNVDGLIFVVDEMEFLDKKPTPTTQAQGVTVSNVSVVAPAQNAVADAVVGQPVAQTPQPIYAQAPVAQAPVAQTPQQVAVAMNAPVVPEGYTGETAPF